MISPSNSEDRRISKFIYRQQIIHLREKNIVYPTERSENAMAFSKLAGQDIRFSMKMMFAAGYWNLAADCLNCYAEHIFCRNLKKDLLYKKRNW